jgi:hypothetical protein
MTVLTALVRPLEVAVIVYVPVASSRQPAKVATPAVAVTGFAVHVRVGPPDVTLRVTAAVLLATVLPLASWMVTTGWVLRTWFTPELEGFLVKASLVAGAVMVTLALTAAVSPLAAAVSV